MKTIMRILLAPIYMILSILIWTSSAVLYCSAFVLGAIATVIGILGAAAAITGDVKNGILLGILAFLISPVGIPMVIVRVLAGIRRLQWYMKEEVY